MTIAEYVSKVLPRMEGWCTAEKASKLSEYAESARLFVEIGVFGGRSLFAGALAQKRSNSLAIGIDPWSKIASVSGFTDTNADWWGKLDHDDIYRKCHAKLVDLNLGASTHLLRCSSAEALLLVKQLEPIQLLHIDGNHSEASALFDVENYVPLVETGSIVAFDDLDWQTTKRAQERLADFCDPIDMVGSCGFYRRK
jgi:hypothetical protein